MLPSHIIKNKPTLILLLQALSTRITESKNLGMRFKATSFFKKKPEFIRSSDTHDPRAVFLPDQRWHPLVNASMLPSNLTITCNHAPLHPARASRRGFCSAGDHRARWVKGLEGYTWTPYDCRPDDWRPGAVFWLAPFVPPDADSACKIKSCRHESPQEVEG